jgi:hypothetical protein
MNHRPRLLLLLLLLLPRAASWDNVVLAFRPS